MAYDQSAIEFKPCAAAQPTAADLALRLDAELRDAHPLTILRRAVCLHPRTRRRETVVGTG